MGAARPVPREAPLRQLQPLVHQGHGQRQLQRLPTLPQLAHGVTTQLRVLVSPPKVAPVALPDRAPQRRLLLPARHTEPVQDVTVAPQSLMLRLQPLRQRQL